MQMHDVVSAFFISFTFSLLYKENVNEMKRNYFRQRSCARSCAEKVDMIRFRCYLTMIEINVHERNEEK